MSEKPGAEQRSTSNLRLMSRAHRVLAGLLSPVLVALMTTPAYAVTVDPTQPPGTAKIQTILNYAGWSVTTVCALGFLAVAGTMAVQHRRGEGGEHLGKLGTVMAATVLGTAAGPIVTALA